MSTDSTTTETKDFEALRAILDQVDALPGAAEFRHLSYDLLAPSPGETVVDVGCGAGRAVAELTERGARAIGIDLSEDMISVARTRWPDSDFRVGNACELPLGDAEATGYRADKLFHELPDPARALAEARRVLSPGGRIVLIGQDWDTLVIDSDDPHLTRRLVHARADTIANPRAARSYRNLLLDNGFTDVTTEVRSAVFTDTTLLPLLTGIAEAAYAAGAATRDRIDGWIAEQTKRAQADRLFLAVPIFVAAAHRTSSPPTDA
ncbi:methyltransferase domain-containing protein [Nocardia uniformis]|nr:methyltransferase domain-containing protein [Nocardia uniformis]